MKKTVIVGMSGGVDSSVAAALLKQATPSNFKKLFGRPTPKGFRGYNVVGVFMKNWADPRYPCPWEEDRKDAMRVAAILEIPFQTWDFSKEYRDQVVSYMIRECEAGKTPNPDVMCNKEIKFGLFLEKALSLGADYVATGHYALKREVKNQKSKVKNKNSRTHQLLEAKDENKDQSYFLWTLTQEQLKHALFPIGEFTKLEVRGMARKFELPTSEKPDSQGVCFVGEIDVAAFLRDHIEKRPGKVLTTSGKIVGEHDGAQFYTIGQRHGLGVGGGIPYYVADKDMHSNTLVVAEGPYDKLLYARELCASELNWISGNKPDMPFKCEARIRYRQPLQSCVIHNSDFMIQVRFDDEQRAVTPGQSVVFYKDGAMLGGGIIQ